jgi:hypothetical protein
MSRGITIFYKLISSDNILIYAYSGANINREYDEKKLQECDGIIEISIDVLENKTAIKTFADKDIKILKECRYEWHEPRLFNGEETVGFLAVNAVSKNFMELKNNRVVADKVAVIY